MRSDNRDRAEELLLHYFDLALGDRIYDPDEIRTLAGYLIDAAKDELRSELLGESRARKCTLAEVLDDPTNLGNT